VGEVEVIFSTLGFFIITGTLLGLSGIAGPSIEIPGGYGGEESEVNQNVVTNALECVGAFITPFLSFDRTFEICQRNVESRAVTIFANILTFGLSFGTFFFQLLTAQLPIPGWLYVLLVSPAVIGVVYVGIRFARGGG